MDQREEWNRAKWASRRGLLELDLLLAPFVVMIVVFDEVVVAVMIEVGIIVTS